jgi:hypothetical protein
MASDVAPGFRGSGKTRSRRHAEEPAGGPEHRERRICMGLKTRNADPSLPRAEPRMTVLREFFRNRFSPAHVTPKGRRYELRYLPRTTLVASGRPCHARSITRIGTRAKARLVRLWAGVAAELRKVGLGQCSHRLNKEPVSPVLKGPLGPGEGNLSKRSERVPSPPYSW